ncbi:MAG: LexA family protein [Cyanobium sp.]
MTSPSSPSLPPSPPPPSAPAPAASAPSQRRRRRCRVGDGRGDGPFEALPAGVPVPLPSTAGPVLRCGLASMAIPAGFPSPADDYAETRIDLNLELIPRPLSTFFMRVRGDAMAGDGILDGDLLVIDRSVRARAGLVVVATHGGSFVVRRLQRGAGGGSAGAATGWHLVASDGCTPPLPLAADDTELWGVVIHAVHHLTLPRRQTR